MTAATAAENVVVKQPPIDTLSSSIASNPQQGMADQRVLTAGTASGTITKGPTPPLAPCSPLTISSALEQQQTAANNPAVVADGVAPVGGIPVAVVGGPFMEAPPAPGVPTAAAPVSSTDERRWKRTPPTESDSRKLFVGGLPTNVNDEQFLCFFEQFGEVIDSVVMVDRNTKRSRGFGFVTFANQQVTDALLNNIPGKTGVLNIFGKSCEIKASEPKVDDGRHDSSSPITRRYPYNGSNNPGGKKMVMQQFNNQHQRVGMPNQYNRDNGYTGDERDFDDVNYHFEPNHQGYNNHGGYHHNMMMYHHPYGYAQYQNYPPNYSTYEGPGPNYEGGEGGGAQYHNYYPAGYYPNQQFHGQYGANPMYHGEGGGNGEGMPPYTQAQQQQHANYGVHYSQDGQMYHGQFNDGGSVGSTSYEAQVYPATTSGVDGDYGQTAAGDTQS